MVVAVVVVVIVGATSVAKGNGEGIATDVAPTKSGVVAAGSYTRLVESGRIRARLYT